VTGGFLLPPDEGFESSGGKNAPSLDEQMPHENPALLSRFDVVERQLYRRIQWKLFI
jgi:hypothetical protein